MSEAIVVGSGPNGLTCAALLARAGAQVTVIEAAEAIGGGSRTSELTVPGVLHDDCSAVQPMAVTSPAFLELGLVGNGLDWDWAEVDLAHPLDGGGGAQLVSSIADTAHGLGSDGAMWERIFGRPARRFEKLSGELARPILHLPRHPLTFVRFGLAAGMPATVLARAFRTEQARALLAGIAAHTYSSLSQPLSSAIGTALICAGHHNGWPVPRGGAQAITDSLAAIVSESGGSIETGRPVSSLGELPATDAVVLDLAPGAVAEVADGRIPDRVAHQLRGYRHGPGAFKVDFAIEGDIPWTYEPCRRAGTVHVCGSYREVVHAEREINRGRMPDRPMMLVAQQYLADRSRSNGEVNPIWSYLHVPSGYDRDATEIAISQIERFAPGFRDRIVATHTRSPAELTDYNANFVGGDILTGANSIRQMIARPRLSLRPYETGAPGVFMCSAATPPGAGVHGLCGYNAARTVLDHLGRT